MYVPVEMENNAIENVRSLEISKRNLRRIVC